VYRRKSCDTAAGGRRLKLLFLVGRQRGGVPRWAAKHRQDVARQSNRGRGERAVLHGFQLRLCRDVSRVWGQLCSRHVRRGKKNVPYRPIRAARAPDRSGHSTEIRQAMGNLVCEPCTRVLFTYLLRSLLTSDFSSGRRNVTKPMGINRKYWKRSNYPKAPSNSN
jgi:hypothetical protein